MGVGRYSVGKNGIGGYIFWIYLMGVDHYNVWIRWMGVGEFGVDRWMLANMACSYARWVLVNIIGGEMMFYRWWRMYVILVLG